MNNAPRTVEQEVQIIKNESKLVLQTLRRKSTVSSCLEV